MHRQKICITRSAAVDIFLRTGKVNTHPCSQGAENELTFENKVWCVTLQEVLMKINLYLNITPKKFEMKKDESVFWKGKGTSQSIFYLRTINER